MASTATLTLFPSTNSEEKLLSKVHGSYQMVLVVVYTGPSKQSEQIQLNGHCTFPYNQKIKLSTQPSIASVHKVLVVGNSLLKGNVLLCLIERKAILHCH